ncbi:unnamed protein product [Somion occarium]|uniref:Zinc-finger domain-containing protein n=1 Tax=Somion occarium TaxID=3059160 RepID=A0ABP1DY82_9APHY
MSSMVATESSQDPIHRPTGSGPSTTSEDPAASLRAAALLTLRSKRKKQNASSELSSSLPPRPVPAEATYFQLDYGQEEPPSGASSTASSSAAIPAPAPVIPSDTPMDVDDSQAREEGEISDSEEPPAAATPSALPKRPSSLSMTSPAAKPKAAAPMTPEKKKVAISPPPRPPPMSPSPDKNRHITAEPAKLSKVLTDMPPPALPARYSQPVIAVDPNHVRPGLDMTQEQYDTAKDIILDLLGWGVPPEYLVNCGLSREIVYYVFVELNLRMPSNLDLTGLPNPETYIDYNAPSSDMQYDDQAPYSPPTLPVGSYRTQGHPSLPQKPRAPQGHSPTLPRSPTSGLSANATPFAPGASPRVDEASLLDMEQQRRQELLARKAVLASRRKTASSAPESASTASLDPETMKSLPRILQRAQSTSSAVAKETVDDFLNSIGPVKDDKSGQAPQRTESPDAMDVDEIPGLSAIEPSSSSRPPPVSANRSLSLSDDLSPISPAFPQSGAFNESFRPASSSQVERRDEDHGMDVDGSGSNTPTNGSSSSSSSAQQVRRPGKRPVAADFVDMEPSRSNGSGPYYHVPRRKAPSSFAGVIATRRMVINLSDSEDEVEDTVNGRMGSGARYRHYSTQHSRATAQSATTTSRVSPRAATPAALLEKEKEIQMMRELIAQREQQKLKKLSGNSMRSTPPAPSLEESNPPNGIAVKLEEDEGVASASLYRAASSEEPSRETTTVAGSMFTSTPSTPTDLIPQALEHQTTGDRVLTDEARQEQVVTRASRSSTPEAFKSSHVQVRAVDSFGETSSAQVCPHLVLSVTIRSLRENKRQPRSIHAHMLHFLRSLQALTSDAQAQHRSDRPQQTEGFLFYQSPLSNYPSLRVHSHLPGIPRTGLTPNQLDLKPLKLAATRKWLQENSSRCICQFEVPGGGECRDRTCEDIHPSKMSTIEPSGTHLTSYALLLTSSSSLIPLPLHSHASSWLRFLLFLIPDEETAEYLCSAMPDGSRITVQDVKAALEEVRRRHTTLDFDNRVKEALASLGLR